MHYGVVVSTVTSQQEGLWYKSQLSTWSVEFACSPQFTVNVNVHGCLFRLSLCDPVMDWQHVQSVACLSPNGSWDRLQPPRTPELD